MFNKPKQLFSLFLIKLSIFLFKFKSLMNIFYKQLKLALEWKRAAENKKHSLFFFSYFYSDSEGSYILKKY